VLEAELCNVLVTDERTAAVLPRGARLAHSIRQPHCSIFAPQQNCGRKTDDTISLSKKRMPMTRLAVGLVSIGLLASPMRNLTGQEGPELPEKFFSDSTLWQRVLTHVVSSLSTYLVRTGVDANPQPWELSLPDNAPQRELLLHQLRTILRARAVTSSDTLIFVLIVGQLTLRNDTAHVTIRTDFGKRCPNSTAIGGFGNIDSVVVPRHPRAGWGVARSVGVLHGDRAGCAGPW
jgi:hypothetical protein